LEEEEQEDLVNDAYKKAGDFGVGWCLDLPDLHRSGRVDASKKLNGLIDWLGDKEEGAY
jgi:hypothetical protein